MAPRPVFVFAHGLFGFEKISLPGYPIHYYRGLADELAHMGVPAVFPKVSSRDGVADRARDLAARIARLRADTLVLVGTSMGGLDARYLAAHLDPDRRVRAVVTVGTPHRGSSAADDTMAGAGPRTWLARMFFDASIGDLTGDACRAFNDAVPDRPDVVYRSHAAARPVGELSLHLRAMGRLIAAREGPNDGLVAVSSAQWGIASPTLRADHMELIGWSFAPASAAAARPFDHLALFRGIVARALQDLA
ncbi:MAG: alpha/beta fold hydrolase [Hyphomicrobiales bacterium]|nr:alpha/beta fold hydrolase [Hyphomicrobiales bacterium]MCP5374008.1 alpha/beta fold hydrolase [Hyphomicrobiales bacterium]